MSAHILNPLLRAFDELRLPPSPRAAAILAARDDLVADAVLADAGPADFCAALQRLYEAVVRPALHAPTLPLRAGMIRFAIDHLLRGADPMPVKFERVAFVNGPYHEPWLGPAFWSAVCQAIDPTRWPAWLPATWIGLRRLRLIGNEAAAPAVMYARHCDAYATILARRPEWTALDVDRFLGCVTRLAGRDLAAVAEEADPAARVGTALVRERGRLPLRSRLKQHGDRREAARRQLETGLHDAHAGKIVAALMMADPPPSLGSVAPADGETLTLWVGRAWESDYPLDIIERFLKDDPLPGAGSGILPVVLHLRDPARFPPWDEASRRGYESLDETCPASETSVESYCRYADGLERLRKLFNIHPFESPALLGALADEVDEASTPREFGGFCPDSFRFLAELTANNRREWMDAERERYLFAVREPMVELCEALAARYVGPILAGVHGWRLESGPRASRSMSSICRNNYGRSPPYETSLWFAFYRQDRLGKRDDAQIFVRLEASGLSFGLYLGRHAEEAGATFRANVERHAPELLDALRRSGALEHCRFAHAPGPRAIAIDVRTPEQLKKWAGGRVLAIVRSLPPESPLLAREEFVGEVLHTFERLLPAIACAFEADPTRWLQPPGDRPPSSPYTADDFRADTFLGGEWLRRTTTLLDLKRQLILQGVPGTGKTHVARGLAKLLTGGREDTIRLVQFHPNYSYEEFVEGIKPRSVEVNGRNEMTYPVENGILCRFAAEAAARPGEPHVLVIDEINRGNLPRVFGELLYLLEYRDQVVGLPYSRRGFRLPANLYLIGTMNAADRSAMSLDRALRRRFSFLEMPPDARILASWLMDNEPKAGDDFAQTVVALFEGLNLRLRNELGPMQQVGHSYFMVPNLDEERLHAVWEHQVRPLLADYFAATPQRLADYELDRLLGKRPKFSGKPKAPA